MNDVTVSTHPDTMPLENLMQQARRAIKQGRKQEARQLLQKALRRDPQNYKAWLWLASLTSSPQASLNYVRRADLLRPDDPTVMKALAWAERRLRTQQPIVEPVAEPEGKSHWQTILIGGSIATLVLLLLAIGVAFVWQNVNAVTPENEQVVMGLTNEDSLARQEDMIQPAATHTPTPTSTPAPRLPAKELASSGASDPRSTWTITPTPSPTPTPTPTWIPTFVSPDYNKSARPFGVKANERWVDIDLSTQTLTAYEGDTPAYITLISSGTWDHPTVTGQFRIWLRYESQTMDGTRLGYDYFLENVPYVMYFYQDYALHGTYWHSNFGNPMSHGCVNMETGDARWLYYWSSLGTMVNVHY